MRCVFLFMGRKGRKRVNVGTLFTWGPACLCCKQEARTAFLPLRSPKLTLGTRGTEQWLRARGLPVQITQPPAALPLWPRPLGQVKAEGEAVACCRCSNNARSQCQGPEQPPGEPRAAVASQSRAVWVTWTTRPYLTCRAQDHSAQGQPGHEAEPPPCERTGTDRPSVPTHVPFISNGLTTAEELCFCGFK